MHSLISTTDELLVTAPKTRVINSVLDNLKKETYDVYESHQLEDGTQVYKKDFKYTGTLTLPSDQAVTLDSPSVGGACILNTCNESENTSVNIG